jgi:hypothetical protein
MNYIGFTRCIHVSNKKIEWKNSKGRKKIGIVISSNLDRYEYIHEFNTHYIEYERYQNAICPERLKEKLNEVEKRVEDELENLFAKLFKKEEGEH